MKTPSRIAILSVATLAVLQAGLAAAQTPRRELWADDSSASLSFGNPEDESATSSSARAEFVNPETDQRVSIASSSFGEPDADAMAAQKARVYYARKSAGSLYPTQ